MKLKFIYDGPKFTFQGIPSNKKYKVKYGQVIEVLDEDFDFFIGLGRNGRPYFEVYVEDNDEELEKVIEEAEKVTDELIEQGTVEVITEVEEVIEFVEEPYDYFEILDGVTEKLHEKIHELGVHNFEELKNKGVDWIAGLPYVDEEKANNIYTQLDEKIGEYNNG